MKIISNNIKVVFWDLDDTLWKGTLAEGDELDIYQNHISIINEAIFYNPGINVVSADMCDDILNLQYLKGKNDSNLTRLEQYRRIKFQIEVNQVQMNFS